MTQRFWTGLLAFCLTLLAEAVVMFLAFLAGVANYSKSSDEDAKAAFTVLLLFIVLALLLIWHLHKRQYRAWANGILAGIFPLLWAMLVSLLWVL